MRLPRVVVALLLASALLSCSEPTAPLVDVEFPVARLIVDGGQGGTPGFFFLPPIATEPPPTSGEFNPHLSWLMSVEICEVTGGECGVPFRTFTSEGPERIHVSESAEAYGLRWSTHADALDPDRDYRIRVLVGGTELGYADVDIVTDERDVVHRASPDVVPVLLGSDLHVAFRIDQAAGGPVFQEGGTVEVGGGAARLDLPPGAVQNPVFIAARPATDLPASPAPIPGTAFDFGPDGIVFGEPVLLTLSYDPAALPPGTDERELRLHKLVGGSYEQVDAGFVDTDANTVSAPIDGFSVYVAMTRLFPGSPEDVSAPLIGKIEILDPGSGTFGAAATVDVSAADETVTFRLAGTDDASGITFFDMGVESPTGIQIRAVCLFSVINLTEGSDTNGKWECPTPWWQYAEAGDWTIRSVRAFDAVGNSRTYLPDGQGGLCADPATCATSQPVLTILSNPDDTTPPLVAALEFGLPGDPGSFGTTLAVDVTNASQEIVLRARLTDDLSGVGGGFSQGIGARISSPRRIADPSDGQSVNASLCVLSSGTTLDGWWDCTVTIPRFSDPGTWLIQLLSVNDRVGNGGFLRGNNFGGVPRDPDGRLCDSDGSCSPPSPQLNVTSIPDTEGPVLESVAMSVVDATVTISIGATDDPAGNSLINLFLVSESSGQSQSCFRFEPPVSGTPQNGIWECSITFPEFSSLGSWFLTTLTLRDEAGNFSFYTRRASDGFMCADRGAGPCTDVGDTEVILN